MMRLATAGVFLLAAIRPGTAALLVAALAPIGGPIGALWGSPRSWTEPLVLALLTGWLIGRAIRDRRLNTAADIAALCLAIVALASVAVQALPHDSGLSIVDAARWLVSNFIGRDLTAFPGGRAGLTLAAGAGLFALAADLGQRQRAALLPPLTRVLLIGGGAVAFFSVNRLIEVSLRREEFLPALLDFLSWYRIAAVFPDVNATGAFFLLLIPIAIDAIYRKTDRAVGVIALPLLLAGLFLAGSRVALVLTPVTIVLTLLLKTASGRQWRRMRVMLGALAVVTALVVVFYPRSGAHGAAITAFEIRVDMARAAIGMWQDAPVFGAGVGRFQRLSPRYMPERVRQHYRSENAHNQFLQVLAELGLVGFAAFAGALACALLPALLTPWRLRASAAWVAGLLAATTGFLLASMSMHPLLIPEVSLMFWLTLGACRAAGRSATAAPPQSAPDSTRHLPA